MQELLERRLHRRNRRIQAPKRGENPPNRAHHRRQFIPAVDHGVHSLRQFIEHLGRSNNHQESKTEQLPNEIRGRRPRRDRADAEPKLDAAQPHRLRRIELIQEEPSSGAGEEELQREPA